MNEKLGFLLAIEGVDGTGKRTQVSALKSIFEAAGRDVAVYAFPDYDCSSLGGTVRRMLLNEYGDATKVHPIFSASLFALERSEKAQSIKRDLAKGRLVICDRYVYSNIAHQACRLPSEKRREFQEWVENLEFDLLGMPRPTATILLDVDDDEAEMRRIKRAEMAGNSRPLDAYESDKVGLASAKLIYNQLSVQLGWKRINAFGGAPEEITSRVLESLSSLVSI